MTDTSIPSEPAHFIVEQNQRLSRSFLWQVQQSFYSLHGIDAWGKGIVPLYITCNPRIANAYAQVVFGFLRDCRAVTDSGIHDQWLPLDLTQPVYIIELGAGSGRFAYHFLRQFSQLHHHSILNDIKVRYVLTDFEPRILQFVQSHPQFIPYIESGQLDTAQLDAVRLQDLVLNHSGLVLSARQVRNPLILIANYVFDSVPQDAFYIEDTQLYENCVTVTSTQPETDLANPDLLKRVQLGFSKRSVTTDYYSDPDYNRILHYYQQRLRHAHVLFPNVVLDTIRYFRHLCNDRMLILTGDKGYHREKALPNVPGPNMALQGSFSMMVNYHAIGQYVTNAGGYALYTSHRHHSLDVCAFVLGRHPLGITETHQAFRQAVETWGPDDFFTLKTSMDKFLESFDVEQMLAYLRLSEWDSNVLRSCWKNLMNRMGSSSDYLKGEVHRALQNVWDNYYHIGEEQDLALQIGSLLYRMTYYPEALSFFQHSLQLYGPKPDTFYNIGMCHYWSREFRAARQSMTDALALDSSLAGAMDMRIRIELELVRGMT